MTKTTEEIIKEIAIDYSINGLEEMDVEDCIADLTEIAEAAKQEERERILEALLKHGQTRISGVEEIQLDFSKLKQIITAPRSEN